MLQRFSSLFLSFFLAIVSYAQETGLGSIHFTTSTKSEKAQEHFITGTLLLHSFEYEDAAEAYRLAQKEDPEMVMAYWGEAMTYNHPIWFQQDREEALSVLLKLGKTATERTAKTPIEMERDWLAAIEVLYGEGDKAVRDERYADYMLNLYQKYPDDNEVAAFCALSILGSSHGGRDEYKYMRSASIVEEVYQKNPDHPGALHYLIHSYDDPVHAPLGMRAAQLYARVAPFAAHALHMPSHIFVAMGMWDEVISSNEHSSAAADARRKRKDLGVDARGYHSLHWLQYGYLQKGRTTDAMRLLIDMEHDFNESKMER
ncbi:MAG: hypothetical protein OEQ53_06085, partial [Saprospiraceae bacterium]|nr:hypothetical protein [Saprospiraceae bacterium]